MKCQILFSGKNRKNISKCRLLKILLRVLSVKIAIFGRWASSLVYLLINFFQSYMLPLFFSGLLSYLVR